MGEGGRLYPRGLMTGMKKALQTPGVLPYKRLIGMCRWMGSHFHDSIDYNGVAFSIDLLEWGGTFRIFGVSGDSKWEDSQVKNQKVVFY